MKNRQTLAVLALVLVLVLSFAACGAKSAPAEDYAANDMASTPMEAPSAAESEEYDITGEISREYGAHIATGGGETAGSTVNPDEKIIYSGDARVETLEFDKTLEDLNKMLIDCGGFIQYSDITGADFNSLHSGRQIYRYANYQLRIPAQSFKSFGENLSSLGNVPYSSSSATNITMEYHDTSARLTARQTEQTRLLELLSKAETIEDVMAIESRLSDVRYEIESLTSQIKNWDNQVSYSTLSLEIQEVALYSEDSPATLSYGEQLKEGFVRTLKAVGRFFKDLLKFLVTALPVLVVLAVVTVIVLVVIKVVRKKKAAKNSENKNE